MSDIYGLTGLQAVRTHVNPHGGLKRVEVGRPGSTQGGSDPR